MRGFFDDFVLLKSETSKILYDAVKDLPIIDYHCHLDEKQIAEDISFDNLGQLWLAGDHYKWRAMRMCGVDEYYITGSATWKDKFLKYAEILPKLCGNPLYYWSHLELKQVFGINKPLNADSAEEIYEIANRKLNSQTVRKLLKGFNVEYIATTDAPDSALLQHMQYEGISVTPTFRPDKILAFDREAIRIIGEAAEINVDTYEGLKSALANRLDYFAGKSCRLADHGFLDFPKCYLSDTTAEVVYQNMEGATKENKDGLFGNLLVYLMKEYKKRGMLVQIHFSVIRNINTPMYHKLGGDAGYDVIGGECDFRSVINFLDQLSDEQRPTILLYSLNPNATAPLASISGAFRNVYIGAAWWFNDTLEGIKNNLAILCEYACLGTHFGMLTDSRSFLSYSRFDFFRRILCNFVGQKAERGEYSLADSEKLVRDICYFNIKNLLGI